VNALAAPASLKGVLSPLDAAAELARGFRAGGAEVVELAVADGGEGTADVLHAARGGTWHLAVVSGPLGAPVEARWLLLADGTAVVDSASALGLPLLSPKERDPLAASSRGLGELLLAVAAAEPESVLIGVGGTATVDGGAGLHAVVGDRLDGLPIRVACDVRNPLLGERGAARAFGPQKGADAATVEVLEQRLATLELLAPYRDLPGAGAGGGLGAGLAALGAELVQGSELVLEAIAFDDHARACDLVVTGEGTADRTTLEGKAPGAVLDHCAELDVRCVLFGGRVRDGVAARALSGDPRRARDDLRALGEELAGLLA
jgi:glycerate 2-kinase